MPTEHNEEKSPKNSSKTLSGDSDAFTAALENACKRLTELENDVISYKLKGRDEILEELIRRYDLRIPMISATYSD